MASEETGELEIEALRKELALRLDFDRWVDARVTEYEKEFERLHAYIDSITHLFDVKTAEAERRMSQMKAEVDGERQGLEAERRRLLDQVEDANRRLQEAEATLAVLRGRLSYRVRHRLGAIAQKPARRGGGPGGPGSAPAGSGPAGSGPAGSGPAGSGPAGG